MKKNTWWYYHFTHVYHKCQSYGVWFLRYWANWQNILSFWTIFYPFNPHNNPKNQNFEKLKKKNSRDIILHKCTKTDDHMLYSSLDMACNGCDCCFSFWAIFCPFTPLTAQKIKIKKKWKKTPGDIVILHKFTKNHDHMLYCYDMVGGRCKCYFSFWAIFCTFTPLTAQNIKT